jgi:hypothetical protein
MTLRMFGPEEMGGIGDTVTKARVVAEQTGQNEEELIKQVAIFVTYTSIIINVLCAVGSPDVRSGGQHPWTPAYV